MSAARRCSYWGKKWRCKRVVRGVWKICAYHRKLKRANAKRARTPGRCSRCGKEPLDGLRKCARCFAQRRMDQLPNLKHHFGWYLRALIRAHDVRSTCAVSGYSLLALRKCGDQLSVDRIDPRLGYVRGNIRVIALSLNVAKGVSASVPERSVQRLARRMLRVRGDRWTRKDAATTKE